MRLLSLPCICVCFLLKLCFIYTRIHDPTSPLICTRYICPLNQGICTRDNKCTCINGFITIQDPKFGDYLCNYQKKSQTVAFLLEFMLGFGVGHFYLGNVPIAVLKLIISFCTAFILCFSPYFPIWTKNRFLKCAIPYLQMLFGIAYCVWQVADGVMIGLNKYTDSNGIEMNEW